MITIGSMHWIYVLASRIVLLVGRVQRRRPPGHKENVLKKVAINAATSSFEASAPAFHNVPSGTDAFGVQMSWAHSRWVKESDDGV